MKKGNDRIFRWRMSAILCFAVTMVILSLVNLYRTQALLNRLEQVQQQARRDCHNLASPLMRNSLSLASATTQRGKSHPDGETTTTRATTKDDTNQHKGGKSVANAATNNVTKDRPVYFLHKRHLNMPHDAFSATFWQSKERFLRVNLDHVQSVEGAIFEQFKVRDVTSGQVVGRLLHEIRMTQDWLDFSVEHLSKWWRTLDYDRGQSPIAYRAIVNKLLALMQNIPEEIVPATNTAMAQTVAVIAYMPYYSELKPIWGQVLTVVNVAATVASLTRHGMARVVVVSDDTTTAEHNAQALVQAAFQLLSLRHNATAFTDWEQTIPRLIRQAEKQLDSDATTEMQIDQTTMAFASVNVTYSWIVEGTNRTNYMTLVPRAALEHLQKALRGEPSTDPNLWLGPGKTPNDYRYVYLTEPDTILHVRPSAMQSIQNEMDQGNFLVPHRIQPAPHETDVLGYKDNRNWIPNFGIMSNITSLYSDLDACCDAGMHRPKDDFPKCNSNWWACGYTQDKLSDEERVAKHVRMHPYGLIRLPDVGTSLVLHAATNHGRRCIPQKEAVCGPPP